MKNNSLFSGRITVIRNASDLKKLAAKALVFNVQNVLQNQYRQKYQRFLDSQQQDSSGWQGMDCDKYLNTTPKFLALIYRSQRSFEIDHCPAVRVTRDDEQYHAQQERIKTPWRFILNPYQLIAFG